MTGAILATLLFASSAIFGQRLSRMLGGIVANFWRLLIAVGCLGALCALFYREQFPAAPAVFWWFFFSGIVGFGIGDVALFVAYFRIGARLTILLNFCLAPVFGAVGEYLWMGEVVSGPEIACICVIIVGIVLALKPDKNRPPQLQRGMVGVGVCAAVVAGMGQGFGAVISRYADHLAAGMNVHMIGIGGGLTQAFMRTLGGLLIGFFFYAGVRWMNARLKRATGLRASEIAAGSGVREPVPERLADRAQHARTGRRGRFLPFWLVGAALTGPVIGVGCFQWALQTQKSAIVLAITATSPLLVMLLARLLEKEKTSPVALAGALLSVSGVIAICLM